MTLREITGRDKCYRCKEMISWKAILFNGNPSGQMTTWSSASQRQAEIAFVGENKVEVLVTCENCRNKSKFIHEMKSSKAP